MSKAKTTDASSKSFSICQLQRELERQLWIRRHLQQTLCAFRFLSAVCAVCILVSFLFMPVLRIYGTSMTPALLEGDVVAALRQLSFERGDVVALNYANQVLVKRIIALPFEWVDLDEQGNFYVNGQRIQEDYVETLSFGERTNVTFPLQVPEGHYFVAGDQRSTSVDSRNASIGCISSDDIVGKLVWTLWPLSRWKGIGSA